MLPKAQKELCLSCHESQTRAEQEIRNGKLAPDARPPFVGAEFALPFRHPITESAYSRIEEDSVACSSCHSPHRGSARAIASEGSDLRRPSTLHPQLLEYELCEQCHGREGIRSQSPRDIARLLDANSRSWHPVHAKARERSPSLRPGREGKEINCTDCHGSSLGGTRGPHGSSVKYLLGRPYVVTDGDRETESTYALCYDCHDRDKVLAADGPFPYHSLHVETAMASCSACHSAHGSITNRALIRFGEETTVAGVLPSMSTGKLAFESESAGSGACFLSCHGIDHAPKAYGALASGLDALRFEDPFAAPSRETLAPPRARDETRPETREKVQPPPP